MSTVTMQAPNGASLKVQFPDGSSGQCDGNGLITVPTTAIAFMQAAGFQLSTLTSGADGITAFPTGGQAGAVPLMATINRVSTVGSANDSVRLPAAVAGLQVVVSNATAATSMNVFPAGTDAINALAPSAAFAIAGAKTCQFFCATAGQWHTILSA